MSKPVTIPNAFAAQVGPIPLSQLDADFTAAANALNDTLTYSNYFVDSSGAPNTITVTVAAPLTFAYTAGALLQVKLANTNTATAVNINVNALGNKTVLLNDGTAPPVGSLTANSILEVIFDGTNFRVMNQRGATTITTGLFADGAVGTPSISYSADPDTGDYRVAANTIGRAVGATAIAEWRLIGANNARTSIYGGDGTSASNALLINNTLNSINLIVVRGDGQAQFVNGAVGSPAQSYLNDTTTGAYLIAAGVYGIACSGVKYFDLAASRLVVGAAALYGQTGSAAAPFYTTQGDIDTGFYFDTPNQIGVGLGGVTAGQIAQGTFTLTSVGITGTPTGTAIWQLWGKTVVLFVPNIQGASSSTSFSFTGLPAALQPARTIFLPVTCLDNSVNAGGTDTGAQLNSGSGTITMYRNGGTATWTAAGTKGIGTSSLGGVMLIYTVA